jgi:phosphatidate cytidylyltransferase
MNQQEDVQINRNICTLGSIALFLCFFYYGMNPAETGIFIPYLVILIYLFISELYLKKKSPINNWAYAMFSQLYVALPFALLNVLAFQTNGIISDSQYLFILPLSIFIFNWVNDTGAYCTGMLLGKHPLFKRISPKKSWEGSIGGCVFSIAAAFALAHFFPIMSTFAWVGMGITVVIFGTWGDLTESLMKRQLGIKDSGNILPGHGGMLDRFDSAIMAIPAAVVYLYIISLCGIA